MRKRNSDVRRGVTASLIVFALFAAALPAAASGRDDVGYVTDLVRRLYLEPLGVSGALLEVRSEYFVAGKRPLSFTVKAGHRGEHKEFEEVLEVGVIAIDGKLLFLSASGPLIESAKRVSPEVRERRIADASRYLESVSAWRATGARQPGRKKNTEELVFDDPSEVPFGTKGPHTAVFNTNTGLLLLAGVPSVPAAESRP